jgi:hypothetical protein
MRLLAPEVPTRSRAIRMPRWHYAVNDYDGPRVCRKVIGG